MKKILVINASARKLNSKSRRLTEVFVDHWKKNGSKPVINYRELGNSNIPHITEQWIAAVGKPESERSVKDLEVLKISNSLISELREADVIVLGSPMYNWSIPSTLKAYIDQILRFNETYTLDHSNNQSRYVGLLENKTLFLLLSRGSEGYEEGEANEHMNFQSTYLKTIFNLMGIHDIHMVAINGASREGEKLDLVTDLSHQRIKELIDLNLALTV